MSAAGAVIVHECEGGFCRVCGELVEYLRESGARFVELDDVLIDTDVLPV